MKMVFSRSISVTTAYSVCLLIASCSIPTGWSFGPTSLLNSKTNKIHEQDSFSCSRRISRTAATTPSPRPIGFNFSSNNRLTSNNRRTTTTSLTRLSYRDFYSLLGVPRNADAGDIKQAYRDMAKKLHPDANKNKKSATELFQEINRAYEVLKDRDLKEKYDAFGDKGIGTSASSDKEATESRSTVHTGSRCEPNTNWRSASNSNSWGNYAGAGNSYGSDERSYGGASSYGGGDSSYYTRSPTGRSGSYSSRSNGSGYGSGGRRSPYNRDYDDGRRSPYGGSTSSERKSPYDGNTSSGRRSPYEGSTSSGRRSPYDGSTSSGRRSPYDSNYGRDPFGEGRTSSPYSTSSSSNNGSDPSSRGRTSSPYGSSNHYGKDPFGEGRVYGGGFSGGFSPQPGGTFGADILEDDYFSGGGSSSSSSSSNGAKVSSGSRTGSIKVGDDLNAYIEIDLIDAKYGGEETITINKKIKCNSCTDGDGIEPGSSVSKCNGCNGYGFTTKRRNSHKCQSCRGTGKTVEQHCGTCQGLGLTSIKKELNVTIPRGVQGSHTVFIEGEGDAGPFGGPAGDLYVFLRVQTDLRP